MSVVPNNDDYYAQVPVTNGTEDTSNKTGALKLKIKAKKTVDSPDVSISSIASAPSLEKSIEDKKSVFKPTISFEAAPKIEVPVRAPTPAFKPNFRNNVTPTPRVGAHPDEFYSKTSRPAANTQAIPNTQAVQT